MAELDLIPADYRYGRRLRQWVRWYLCGFALLLALVAAAWAGLARGARAEADSIQRLQASKQVTLGQIALLQDLSARKAEAERRIEILRGLRGGPAAEQIFQAIDRALAGDVWFLSWNFRRAGEIVEMEPDAVEAGYFIVVPKGQKQQADRAWRLQTHMEIRGQARDHTALSAFVKRLLAEPEIEDVRVLSTTLRVYLTTQVVDFDLAVVVRSRPEGAG